MGCFCRHIELPPKPAPDEEREKKRAEAVEPTDEPAAPRVIAALAEALSARWLPPALPFEPEPKWKDLEFPPMPMSPRAVSTLIRLVYAQQSIKHVLTLDPSEPTHLKQLVRIVATLNRRTERLEELAEDKRPWSALDVLNGQADTVQQALAAKVLDRDPEEQEPIGPWRPLLARIRPLLPIVAVTKMLELDVRDPVTALDTLTITIRKLRKVVLPPLAKPHLVMRLIARHEAIARLESSLGRMPYEAMREKVERKVQAVQEQLPRKLKVGPDGLEGIPQLVPNPSLMLNKQTIAAVQELDPEFVARLKWTEPPDLDPPLLTVGAPVAALVKTGVATVRSRPCDGGCDAAQALDTALATASPDSGTDAAPAA